MADTSFDRLRHRAGFALAPAVFVLVLLLPLDLPEPALRLAAVMALVITLWMTEAIPLPVTALLGPTLAIVLGVAPAGEAFGPFADPIIFLFLGSFILARAIFVHRLNERIAYGVMSWKIVGARPTRILVAFGGIAAFLSAWMSNTATAAMLMPVGISLLAFMESESEIGPRYGTALMLATAYGCSLGGMATIVGTPPNGIAVGMIRDQAGVDISFVEWMAFAGPISVVMVGFLVLYMNWIGATGMREIQGAERIIHERKAALGPWKRGEKNALIAFLVTVGLWLTSGILPRLLGADHPVAAFISGALPTAVPAIIGAVLLFLMPVSPTQRSTISWDEAARIDWGTILLFGGGLSLGSMAGTTGLAEAFGNGITGVVPVSSLVALTVASAVFATVFSETMSNTAAATIAIPIIISIAQAAGTNPVPPAVAASLAASVAVILPVSTPPNAIVFSTGKVPLTKMVRYGVAMDIVAVIVIPVVVLLFLA